jgi:predicted nucleic acid-binding protein
MYLLDVNVLLAVGYRWHDLHERANKWLTELQAADPSVHLATCSITELGFVRIASGKAGLAQNVAVAQADLKRMKQQRLFTLLDDGLDANRLPEWVGNSKQVTDGHLLQLAAEHRATLATLDEAIPGALLIPKDTTGPLFVREPQVPYRIAA